MSALGLLELNLLSPVVLAFALGVAAALLRSDLRYPEALSTALSIYLLLAIGMKGGAALAATPAGLVWRGALATLLFGCASPLVAYAALRRLGRFEVADAAAIAAHYGSVSVVTFTASGAFLEALGVPYEGFMATLVALMEIPGIAVALALARARLGGAGHWTGSLREVLTGRSIVLLAGGLVIGAAAGARGYAQVAPLFVEPFLGVLTLFLLDMGLIAARRLRDLRRTGAFLVGFGMLYPLVQGVAGVGVATIAGLSPGGATVFGTMAASASYIAAPAAVRLALPQANPSYYLTLALGITFPFNLVLGIPIYHALARVLGGGA